MKELGLDQKLFRIYGNIRAEAPDVFGRRRATGREVAQVLRQSNDFYSLVDQHLPSTQDIKEKGDDKIRAHFQRRSMRRIRRSGK